MQSQNKKMTRFKNAIRQHDIISKSISDNIGDLVPP